MSWILKYDTGRDEEPVSLGFMNATGSGKSDYALNLPQFRDTVWAFPDDEGGYRLSVMMGEYNGKQKWGNIGLMIEDGDDFRINIYTFPNVVVAEPFTRSGDERRKPSW
jgi:hypothetical protein